MSGMTSLTSAAVSRQAVAEYLEERITAGEFQPGDRIPSERHLAEELKVSRPIVREALRSLAARDLVQVLPGRGTFVRAPSVAEGASRLDAVYRTANVTPRDLVEARTMLECTAAELAAGRASREDLEALRQAVDGCERGPTIIDQARYDLAFHLGIAQASKNAVIETMFRSISALTLELMLRSLSDPQIVAISFPFHRSVLAAIEAREGEAARLAMAEHLAVASRLYGADYEASIESVARRELERLFAPGVRIEDLLPEIQP